MGLGIAVGDGIAVAVGAGVGTGVDRGMDVGLGSDVVVGTALAVARMEDVVGWWVGKSGWDGLCAQPKASASRSATNARHPDLFACFFNSL